MRTLKARCILRWFTLVGALVLVTVLSTGNAGASVDPCMPDTTSGRSVQLPPDVCPAEPPRVEWTVDPRSGTFSACARIIYDRVESRYAVAINHAGVTIEHEDPLFFGGTIWPHNGDGEIVSGSNSNPTATVCVDGAGHHRTGDLIYHVTAQSSYDPAREITVVTQTLNCGKSDALGVLCVPGPLVVRRTHIPA